ncbi:MAG: DUF899 family protein [Streptosporangiaceae bacterium]|nr:DUF899 family protein [Streptosporangiaceae bacterium]
MSDAILPMWPVGTSKDYIEARIELARAERVLRDQVEAVAAARRRMPPGAVLGDYTFQEGPADLFADDTSRPVRLRELFGERGTLLVYHLMFGPEDAEACPMCSMWVDGFNGVAAHIAQHTSFAVIGKAPLAKLREWARRRAWNNLRIVSSYGTTFNADMRAEKPNGEQRPMISVLGKDGTDVRHFYTLPANFLDDAQRGIDLLSPVWNILDLLPTGRGDWYAENSYESDLR